MTKESGKEQVMKVEITNEGNGKEVSRHQETMAAVKESSTLGRFISGILTDPAHFVRHAKLKNSVPVMIRPVRTSDESLLSRLHEKLSERSIHLRYFSFPSLSYRIAQLARICRSSDREFAIVTVVRNETTQEQEIIALGEMARLGDPLEAELGVIVRDDYQNQGLGTRMCKSLLEISRAAGAHRMTSLISWENYTMRHIARRLGCNLEYILGEHAVRASLAL
jgi:acetyltransferase